MKLRINSNSVALRLSPDDMEKLSAGHIVMDSLRIGDTSFIFEVKLENDPEIDMHLKNNFLQFSLPGKDFNKWKQSSKVGFHRNFGDVELVIEKDLKPRRK